MRALVFLAYFTISLLLEYRAGAWTSGWTGDDEPAHLVNALLVRDYVTSVAHGHWEHPLSFAREYRRHYPKVAIGHWPPLFSLAAAAWFFVVPPNPAAALAFLSLWLAGLGLVVFQELRKYAVPPWLAAAWGSLVLLAPVGQRAHIDFLIEPAWAFLVVVATIQFIRFLETRRTRHAVLFGVWAALALLTKASAGALALVPILAIAFARKWNSRLLLPLAYPVAIVLLGAGPWYWWTRHWLTGEMLPGGDASHWDRLPRLLQLQAAWLSNPIVLLLTVLAITGWFWRRDAASAGWAALAVSIWVFHTLVSPHGEIRFYLAAIAPALIAAGGLLQKAPVWVSPVTCLAILALSFITPPEYRRPHGAADAINFLESRNASVTLIASAKGSEGALIAEACARRRIPAPYLLRVTKMLASTDWMMVRYSERFDNAGELGAWLERSPIQSVVIDRAPSPQLERLRDVLTNSGYWQEVYNSQFSFVYERVNGQAPAMDPAFQSEIDTRLGQ